MKPTMLQLSLSVVVRCTESSDTQYSEVAQTWTLWCGDNCPPPVVSHIDKDWRVSSKKI
jgi:hypothetical protein